MNSTIQEAVQEIDLDYEEISWLIDQEGWEALRLALADDVYRFGFKRTEETEWAYLRLATYLGKDGWSACQNYFEMKSDSLYKKELGVWLNKLVGGCRFTKEESEKSGARWVFADERGDAAALLFYCATKSPETFKR